MKIALTDDELRRIEDQALDLVPPGTIYPSAAQVVAMRARIEGVLRRQALEIKRLRAALVQAALMKTIKGARVIVADALEEPKP